MQKVSAKGFLKVKYFKCMLPF